MDLKSSASGEPRTGRVRARPFGQGGTGVTARPAFGRTQPSSGASQRGRRPEGRAPASPKLEPGRAGRRAPVGHRKIRVLLADDHSILRDGLRQALEAQGDLEVVGEAANGRRAVELAHQLQPDIVIMDVSMPLLSGIEATRRISAELPRVRVIGLSMFEEIDWGAAMRAAGAVAYLSKSEPTRRLVALIRDHAGRARERRAGSKGQGAGGRVRG